MSFKIYDYRCENCDEVVELMVKSGEQDSQFCSNCPEVETPMKRLMPGPITKFKFGDRSAIKSRKAVSLRDKH